LCRHRQEGRLQAAEEEKAGRPGEVKGDS
jgi:hypothetical protein